MERETGIEPIDKSVRRHSMAAAETPMELVSHRYRVLQKKRAMALTASWRSPARSRLGSACRLWAA